MKVFLPLCTLLALVAAEPPVSREYLPPSEEYGPPPATSNNGLSTQYGAPSTQYGAPSSQYGAPSSQYGAPSAQYGAPSTQYGAPSAAAAFGRSGSSSFGSAARLSSSFGGIGGLSRRIGAGRIGAGRIGAGRIGSGRIGSGLSTQYGAPSAFGRGGFGGSQGISSQYGVPSGSGLSTQYGVPAAGYSSLNGARGLSTEYGVPGYGRGRAQEDPLAEPANYQFSYAVQDAATLSDFGHDEVRQDENAEGEYRVLLPDGRKQIVRYQADQDGYRPSISYEDTGITANSAGNGYGRGPAGGNGGYHY